MGDYAVRYERGRWRVYLCWHEPIAPRWWRAALLNNGYKRIESVHARFRSVGAVMFFGCAE